MLQIKERTVEHWVQSFLKEGLESLHKRRGPRNGVTEAVIKEVIIAMKERPQDFFRKKNDTKFTGDIISAYIKSEHNKDYSERAAQVFLAELRRKKRKRYPGFDIPGL